MIIVVFIALFLSFCLGVFVALLRWSCSSDPYYGLVDEALDRAEYIRRSHAAKGTSATILEFKR